MAIGQGCGRFRQTLTRTPWKIESQPSWEMSDSQPCPGHSHEVTSPQYEAQSRSEREVISDTK